MKKKSLVGEFVMLLLNATLYACGVAAIVYGLSAIYKPLGYIAFGVVCLSVGRAIVKTQADNATRKEDGK